jgi:hypothetical protein
MKGLIGLTPIENAFYNMGKEDPKMQEYFFTYYSQKLVLLNHFYPYVTTVIPHYTDHGQKHVVRLMELCGRLLKNSVPGLADAPILDATSFNFYEIYLLLCATVWHDVGNLLGRERHNEKITKVANRLKKHFFVDKDIEEYAFQIAKAHTGQDGVRREIPVDSTDYMNNEINLRFLGATLRFADELEEGEVRIDKNYYEAMKDKIPADKRIYWETSCCIKRIEPHPENCSIEAHAQIKKDLLFKLLEKNGKKVALVDELIFRFDKMNEERKYYMQFVRKHIEYNEIVLDLAVGNARVNKITFRFDNDHGYNDFWYDRSEVNPEKHKRGYTLQKRWKNAN